MTFQQKNNTVSLASFSLLLIFYLLRVVQLVRNQNFNGIVAKVARGRFSLDLIPI